MKFIKNIIFLFLIIGIVTLFLIIKPDYAFILKQQLTPRKSITLKEISFTNEQLQNIPIEDSKITQNTHLMLINQQYPIPETYSLDLVNYKESDMYLEASITDAYTQLVEATMQKTNEPLYIMSSYRDRQKQIDLYNENPKVTTLPGTSEHEVGKGIDVYTYQYAGMSFLKSKAGQFVNTYLDDYGFIIRYPFNHQSHTNITYEPWHIRYVGLPHSQIITQNRWCLEEYIYHLKLGVFYKVDNYIISKQNGSTFQIPLDAYEISISLDNTGSYIMTCKIEELH